VWGQEKGEAERAEGTGEATGLRKAGEVDFWGPREEEREDLGLMVVSWQYIQRSVCRIANSPCRARKLTILSQDRRRGNRHCHRSRSSLSRTYRMC
jgi:hypothetical protein